MLEEERVEILVHRAQEGDRSAFEKLVAKYRDRLLGSIRSRFRSRERAGTDPEDVLNEVILRAFESLEHFQWKDEDSFLKWLFGICRNVRLDAARRARPTLSLEAAEGAEAGGPTPSQALRREERFHRLRKAIDLLPSDYREVVYLSRIEGLKTKEVAVRLGKSTDSVKHLLARALKLLRETLGETKSFHLPNRSLLEGEGHHGE